MAFDQKTQANHIYEEFEPTSDWEHEEGSDTLILMLPGFKKEQLRVQVTSTRVLRVSGERQINENQWRRFRKEFPMPSYSETSGITAKFEAGILYVKLPKLINKQPPATTTTPTPREEAPKSPAATTTTPTPTPRQEAPKPHQPITTPQTPTPRQEAPKPHQPITTPQTPNNAQVSDQKQPRVLVDKTGPKKEKGKELKDDDDDVINSKVAKKRSEGGVSKVEEKKETGSDDHELSKTEGKMMEKKSLTMEMLSQRKEYMNALSGFVDEVKKQKKLVNKLVLIFLVLLVAIYIKNVIKSYF